MARDEEIFRKLKKQTPIVKRKDLQPLSKRDFDPRQKALELLSNKVRPGDKRAELNVFTSAPSKTALHKNIDKRSTELASRYQNAKRQPRESDELDVFGVRERPKKAPAKPRTSGTQRPAAERSKPVREETAQLKNPIPVTHRSHHAPAPQPSQRPHPQPPQRPQQRTQTEPEQQRYPQSYRHEAPVVRADQHTIDYLKMPAEHGRLAYRHELKYYINYHDYVLLKNTLKPLLSLDSNAGPDGHYHIRSLYFDDVYESALKEKIAGTDERHKYRIRIYNYSDSVIRFEKKIKTGQFIAKKSFMLSRDDCDSLIAGDCSVLEGRREPLANEIFLQMKNNALKPRVIVDYWREAYVSPFENVRITFDKDIKGGLWLTDIFNAHAPTMPILDEGTMVLEVKFNRYLPIHIKAVLNNIDTAQRSAISKYVLCRKFD